MKGKTTPKEIKDEILGRIHSGEKVSDLAQTYGILSRTIYSWLSKKTQVGMSSLAVSQLRRENQALKLLVGELSLQVSKRGGKERS